MPKSALAQIVRMTAKTESNRESRFNRLILTAIVVALVIVAAHEFGGAIVLGDRATAGRGARGYLADYEGATIAIFDRVSPSVVQVVGAVKTSVPVDIADLGSGR
jgi:hypothetical protein